MNSIIKLSLSALLPIISSIVLHFVFKKSKESYWTSNIIAGLIFGGIAIMATEYGVPLNGAVMNVRDGAVLCAALIFGAPAGIIAGLIGGIERWFAVLWGAGSYTRLACSISTCLAGLIGAVLKKYMFEDKIPSYRYSFIIGVVVEELHMLMVFITNMTDIEQAFKVVQACTLIMVSINAITVTIAILAINIFDREANFDRSEKPTLSQQFLRRMLVLIFVGLVSSTFFSSDMQKRLSMKDTENQFILNIQDIKNDVDNKSDSNILDICGYVVSDLKDAHYSNRLLIELAKKYNVTEINIVNNEGIIDYSTNPDYIGFDMNSGDQAREFITLLRGVKTYVQKYQSATYDSSVYKKYAGQALDNGGFIQVGYDAEEFTTDLTKQIKNTTTNRHIGKNGGMMIVNSDMIVVSGESGNDEKSLEDLKLSYIPNECEENTLYTCTLNNEECYFMYTKAEGFLILAYLPVDEVDFTNNLTIYLNIFMLTIVFAGLFILMFFLTKLLVVDNIQSVDESLQKITDGNLDTSVNIRINKEFDSLSNGINTTVDSMKKLIADANKRIDDELQYAKEIQASALPSVFPPFHDVDEFDIYATMNPAKEVGGDFYDFYMLDKHTIAFLIADVAGKGIPAALFMMRAKTLLKTYAMGGIQVADIFTNANFNLCEGNDAGMFVTSWMGFLDTQTGELKYANAGHNKPLIRRKDGTYEYLQGPAGFVLGGMEGIVYKEQSITLEVGDEIFLYTDGVTEATNIEKNLYGDDRLKECINEHKDEQSCDLVTHIKEDVDKFYDGAPQFDDITMLSIKYTKQFNR